MERTMCIFMTDYRYDRDIVVRRCSRVLKTNRRHFDLLLGKVLFAKTERSVG